ncbi:hypothetical protein [Haladaptatus sp. DJG-WS-42]|uniref:hypothetical protein n=1 Tax=Haladaptatus sp. DJG-WS-42 TaxID=3120516 RepID=UPI0030D2DEB8
MVYATRGLLTVLRDYAKGAAPEPVVFVLATTPAESFTDHLDLPAETPVFSHFYLADSGTSVSAVFGVDLNSPAKQSQGRFISAPDGFSDSPTGRERSETVFIATPPWNEAAIRVYDATGTVQPLTIVDAEPPEDPLP